LYHISAYFTWKHIAEKRSLASFSEWLELSIGSSNQGSNTSL